MQAISLMKSEMWCAACNKAVAVSASHGVALLVAPLAGLATSALPRLFRKRFGVAGMAAQGAAGIAVGYLTKRYLVPRLQQYVCRECGGKVSAVA